MMRMSSEAREAVERAQRRGGVPDDRLTLLDIGLITAQSNREGMVMRRTRSVSLDDDGVRPFITLHVQPDRADQTARIRFELIDSGGSAQYVHEMRTYLRDGEMNILADHQLPLSENALQAGDWDLRVFLDGKLIGAHMFTLAPSLTDRYPRAASRPAATPAPRQPLEADESSSAREPEDAPLSLEDLLRSRGNRNS
jgi:hypothetical protein